MHRDGCRDEGRWGTVSMVPPDDAEFMLPPTLSNAVADTIGASYVQI